MHHVEGKVHRENEEGYPNHHIDHHLGGERRHQVLEVAAKVYSSIEDTTDIAIAFNDKYDEHDHLLDFSNFQNDLAMLGEAMSNRADYEDWLIEALVS